MGKQMITSSVFFSHLMSLKADLKDADNRLDTLIQLAAAGVTPEGHTAESYLDELFLEFDKMRSAGGTEAPPHLNQAAPAGQSSGWKGSGFVFGKSSLKELIGVKPALVECVHMALHLSTQDFMVFDGIRSLTEQAAHVKNGTSKTMSSKHLDGLAVDLVPFINGKPTWDWDGCYKIAMAMDQAATQLGYANKITWGGAWDRRLSDFGGDPRNYRLEVENYKKRHAGSDFIDGPHFEWVS